jgi:hypothetical protein
MGQINLRTTPRDEALIAALRERLGIESTADIIRHALTRLAQQEGIDVSSLTDDAWARRVGELRRLASDLVKTHPAELADYDGDRRRYVDDLVAIAAETDKSMRIEGVTDPDEVRVLRAQLERLAG